jgi:putative membrane protein
MSVILKPTDDLENYKRFQEGMILRDYLARDRTLLASERTLLAYVRTFAGFFAAGMGVIKVFDTPVAAVAGAALILTAPVFLIVGFSRFFYMQKRLKSLSKALPEKEKQGGLQTQVSGQRQA